MLFFLKGVNIVVCLSFRAFGNRRISGVADSDNVYINEWVIPCLTRRFGGKDVDKSVFSSSEKISNCDSIRILFNYIHALRNEPLWSFRSHLPGGPQGLKEASGFRSV
jgi:hypothetical protein